MNRRIKTGFIRPNNYNGHPGGVYFVIENGKAIFMGTIDELPEYRK